MGSVPYTNYSDDIKEGKNMEITLGDILRGIRKCSGITQADFAKQIKVSQSFVSKLEKNETSPTIEMLDKYAEFFGIEPELILKFRKIEDKNSLSQKIRIALFSRLIYDSQKDPFNDVTEL